MKTELREEHRWLERLVGDWTYESEAITEPGEPPARFTGTERVRSLDGVWVLCEGRGDVPGGGTGTTIMTLGYDPVKQRHVGTFVGSTMTHLWIYEGGLDPARTALTLDTEGPGFTDDATTAKYRDVMELRGDDERVLTSSVLSADGAWRQFMTSTYRRAK